MWFEKVKISYQSSRWSSQKTRHCRSDIYHRLLKSNYYFQQDGASPHTSKKAQNYLRSKFGEKFIDKKKWPPRSPDLNPCDYFLWGYLKSRIYNPLSKDLDDLKANIQREIKNISTDTLKNVIINFSKRCDSYCHIDNVL
jgi:hypothetical protein